jgi:hypothetical protein
VFDPGQTAQHRPGPDRDRLIVASPAVAWLCIAAGADETLIPQWVAEGRRGAAAARQKPGTWRAAP